GQPGPPARTARQGTRSRLILMITDTLGAIRTRSSVIMDHGDRGAAGPAGPGEVRARGGRRPAPVRAPPAGSRLLVFPLAASCPAREEGNRHKTRPPLPCRPRTSRLAAPEPGPGPA